MSAATPAPKLALSWRQSAPPPPPQPCKWMMNGAHEGRTFTLKVQPFSKTTWCWTASLDSFSGSMFLMGYADNAEAAKQDAQAVAELYVSGRPLFLNRRPTLSVSTLTEPQPAPAVQP